MATKTPTEEASTQENQVSITVTHSISVQNAVPSVPFHEMPTQIPQNPEETILGESDQVVWQPSPVARRNEYDLIVTRP